MLAGVSVALVRDGAGATAGFGPLALLPVIWAALRARRAELTVAVAGVAFIYLAPAVVIGPPRYPTGAWRAGLLFTLIAAVLERVRAARGEARFSAGLAQAAPDSTPASILEAADRALYVAKRRRRDGSRRRPGPNGPLRAPAINR